MHPHTEYHEVLTRMFKKAQQIARHVEKHADNAEAQEVLMFCIRHGYIGYPISPTTFSYGGWLKPGRDGGPLNKEEAAHAIAVVPCFHDDPTPGGEELIREESSRVVSQSAYVSETNRLLVLTNVDVFPTFDRAVTLLHEGRHVRQHFGTLFEGLKNLDPPELHETRTWEFRLRILDACGGNSWRRAVEQEAERLREKLRASGRRAGDRYFAMSNVYCDELDVVFGRAEHERVRQERNLLVAMRALFSLAACEGISDDVAHRNIVGRYYAWSHGHRGRSLPPR